MKERKLKPVAFKSGPSPDFTIFWGDNAPLGCIQRLKEHLNQTSGFPFSTVLEGLYSTSTVVPARISSGSV